DWRAVEVSTFCKFIEKRLQTMREERELMRMEEGESEEQKEEKKERDEGWRREEKEINRFIHELADAKIVVQCNSAVVSNSSSSSSSSRSLSSSSHRITLSASSSFPPLPPSLFSPLFSSLSSIFSSLSSFHPSFFTSLINYYTDRTLGNLRIQQTPNRDLFS